MLALAVAWGLKAIGDQQAPGGDQAYPGTADPRVAATAQGLSLALAVAAALALAWRVGLQGTGRTRFASSAERAAADAAGGGSDDAGSALLTCGCADPGKINGTAAKVRASPPV